MCRAGDRAVSATISEASSALGGWHHQFVLLDPACVVLGLTGGGAVVMVLQVLQLAAAEKLGGLLVPGQPYLEAEVIHACRCVSVEVFEPWAMTNKMAACAVVRGEVILSSAGTTCCGTCDVYKCLRMPSLTGR